MMNSTHPKCSGSAAAGLCCVFMFLPQACPDLVIMYLYVVNFLFFLTNGRAPAAISKKNK
jgi:hypothetical protein